MLSAFSIPPCCFYLVYLSLCAPSGVYTNRRFPTEHHTSFTTVIPHRNTRDSSVGDWFGKRIRSIFCFFFSPGVDLASSAFWNMPIFDLDLDLTQSSSQSLCDLAARPAAQHALLVLCMDSLPLSVVCCLWFWAFVGRSAREEKTALLACMILLGGGAGGTHLSFVSRSPT